MSDKTKMVLILGLTTLFTFVLLGTYYVTQHKVGSNIKEMDASILMDMGKYSDYQKVDFRKAAEYNEGHIEGFIRRNSQDIGTSDQLYEDKVFAVGDVNTPWDEIIASLDYLGIDTFHYVSDFSLYNGPFVNLLGACGEDGLGCGLEIEDEGMEDNILQYGVYLGDDLFLNLGGSVESYTGIAFVRGDEFTELTEGQLYRYKTNGIMAMSYPGQMGGSSLTEVKSPVALEAYSEDLVGSLTSPDFPHDLKVEVVDVDEAKVAEILTDEIQPGTLYIVESPTNDRLSVELTALELLNSGATLVVKNVYDTNKPTERDSLTVEDAELFLELQDNRDVHLWDVRNQGYDLGHVKGFKEMPQSEIQNTQFSDEDAQDLYVIYCKTGGVTSEVKDILAQKGIYNVIDLGGLTGANVDLVQE